MKLLFITGNADKLHEIKSVIPGIEGLEIDLAEIQHIDPKVVIEAKLREALRYRSGPFIVEDTSLYLNALNGLPGPLIKWFLAAVGVEGLYSIAQGRGDTHAKAQTIIGFISEAGEVEYFEGVVEGYVVPPRGSNGFGWDAIFQPKGSTQTFAEMTDEQKNELSMRKVAAQKLRDHLAL